MNTAFETACKNTDAIEQDRFNQALVDFVAWYQNVENVRYANSSWAHPLVTFETGSKNIRIVVQVASSRSSACFVRRSDGAVLKCAGWKAPFIAKGGPNAPMTIRGSIYDIKNLNSSRWA